MADQYKPPPPPPGAVEYSPPPPPPGATAASSGPASDPDEGPSGVIGQAGDMAQAATQGAILDPVEKVGQMAEHLPDWAGGALARRAGAALPDWLQGYLTRSQAAGERHPWVRTAGNVLPWLAVPGVGEGVAADMALGAASGVLQPTDPKDPNYWTTVAHQAGLGGVLGGGIGQIARNVAGTAAAQKAYQVAQRAEQQFFDQTPERATTGVYERIAREAGDPSLVPKEITPTTAPEVREAVGKKLGATYNQLKFDPAAPGWATGAETVRNTVRNALTDPAMRKDWEQAFVDDAGKPIFLADPANPAAPITGDKLNQLMSHLSDVANDFGRRSQQGGGRPYQIMANGLRRISDSIEAQFRALNPAVATQRRALNRAYQLADGMLKATTASKGGVATPSRIISTLEKKFGKPGYATRRFGSTKDMLETERQRQAAGPVQLQPPGPAPGRAARVTGQGATHAAAIAALHHAGLPLWAAAPLGAGLVETARRAGAGKLAARAAETAGKRAGVGTAGAVGGQAGPSVSYEIQSILPGGNDASQGQ